MKYALILLIAFLSTSAYADVFRGEKLSGSLWGAAASTSSTLAVGTKGTVYIREKDGWRPLAAPGLSYWAAAAAPDGSFLLGGGTGLVRGSGEIRRFSPETNSYVTVLETGAPVTELRLSESGEGIAVDQGGSVHLTDDGGASWYTVEPKLGLRLWSAVRTEAGDILVAGGDTPWQNDKSSYGKIFIKEKGADTWREIYRGPSRVSDIEFISAETGYAAGVSGLMLKTEDGGKTWQDLPNAPFRAIVNAIAFPYESCGLAVGSGGTAYVTTDGGATWPHEIVVTKGSFLEDLAEIAPGIYLVVAGDGSVGTIDLKGLC